MIEIMVVDDQRLVRRCISAKLNAVADFSVTAEVASGEEARDAARTRHFDVILMDLNMPGIGGLEATRRVLAVKPECRIVGLSMYISGPYPKQFLRAGGVGYVSKNTDTEELLRAIRAVNQGECYISADVAQYRRQRLDKLGARNDVQLAGIARDQGLADLESQRED